MQPLHNGSKWLCTCHYCRYTSRELSYRRSLKRGEKQQAVKDIDRETDTAVSSRYR